jgi:hypothetical protein
MCVPDSQSAANTGNALFPFQKDPKSHERLMDSVPEGAFKAPEQPAPPSPQPAASARPAAPQLQTPTTVQQQKTRGTRVTRKKTNRQSISTGLSASAPGASSGGLNL